MRKVLFLFVLALVLGTTASASIITENAALAEGTYYGSGNPNVDWTVLTDGNLELGLGVVQRFVGPIASQPDGDFDVANGATQVSGKTGSWWGFEFDFDSNVNGEGGLGVADYSYLLSVADLNTGKFTFLDPSAIGDDAHLGTIGFQNSEALSFGFLAVPLVYDINATDTYEITLVATPKTGGVPESLTINVNAQTPEPATWFLVVAPLLFVVYRRQRFFVI